MQLQKNDIEDKDTILELKIQKGGDILHSLFGLWNAFSCFRTIEEQDVTLPPNLFPLWIEKYVLKKYVLSPKS